MENYEGPSIAAALEHQVRDGAPATMARSDPNELVAP